MATNRQQVAGLCLVLLAGGSVYVAAQGIEHVEQYELVRKGANFPQAYAIPVSIPNTTPADEPNGQRVEVYGVSFLLPAKLRERRELGAAQSTLVLETGQEVTVLNPQQMGLSSPFTMMDGGEREVLQRSFALEPASPNYGWIRAALNTTPKDVSLFHPGERNLMTGWLLTTKQSSFGEKARDVYAVSWGTWRGFEVGTPSDGATEIQLRLFDAQDRPLRLWVRESAVGPRFTQPEINALLLSLERKPEFGAVAR